MYSSQIKKPFGDAIALRIGQVLLDERFYRPAPQLRRHLQTFNHLEAGGRDARIRRDDPGEFSKLREPLGLHWFRVSKA
jgi:hypothetical protein